MAMTPWGDSATLRERGLRPIRGAPRERVAENQRERLFAATVAVVSEKGFAAATLAELLSLSGVSSRSFYRLFPDKTACLQATVRAIQARCEDALDLPAEIDDLPSGLRHYYLTLCDAAAAQPAALKVCLLDSFAGGPAVRRPLERARARVEANLRRLYRADPEREEIPEEVLAARVGAVLEVVSSRLLSHAAPELTELADDLLAFLLADGPPPPSLLPPVRPPRSSPEISSAPAAVERSIRGFAVLVAEQGYRETNAEDVIRLAEMSSTTFYANFSGKADLMAAAIDSACAQAVAAVTPAFSRAAEWPEAVRSGFSALFSFLSSRPDLARLVGVEAHVAGEAALERLNQALAPLGSLLVNNTSEWSVMAPLTYELIAATNRSLIFNALERHGAGALPGLAPLCTYLTLLPFLGRDSAAEVALSGPGLRPGASPVPGRRFQASRPFAFEDQINWPLWQALIIVAERDASAAEIAAEIDADPAAVEDFLAELAASGALETITDGDQLRYRDSGSPQGLIVCSAQQEAATSPEQRMQFHRGVWGLVVSDVEGAMLEETFRKPDVWLTRSAFAVDRQGRRELTELHDQFLMAILRVQFQSAERLRKSGEDPSQVRAIQLAFERRPRHLLAVDHPESTDEAAPG